MRYTNAPITLLNKKMKAVLKKLQTEPCREREISENEKTTFSNYLHLQRYHPALDLFKISDSTLSYKNLELNSKYFIDNWLSQDETNPKIWNTTRSSDKSTVSEPCKTFIKTIHYFICKRYLV